MCVAVNGFICYGDFIWGENILYHEVSPKVEQEFFAIRHLCLAPGGYFWMKASVVLFLVRS